MESNKKIKTNENWLKLIFFRLSLMLLAITLLIALSFCFIDAQYYPVFFPVIPIFYIICGLLLGNLAMKTGKSQNGTSIRKIVAVRMIRITGSIIILVGAMMFDSTHAMPFAIIFAIYYIAYLLFETKVMTDLNKNKNV